MTVWVFGSAHGSPGATTTALAVAGCLPAAVLVEADADGGVLAVRYGLGRDPGVATLAGVRGALSPEVLRAHAQRLPGGLLVLAGPESPSRAEMLWSTAGDRLAGALAEVADTDVVADAGRITSRSPSVRELVRRASAVVLVVRPVAAELVVAAHALHDLREHQPSVGLVLVGDGPYAAADVSASLDCDVLGVVADDRRSAEALAHGGGSSRHLARSPLARSAKRLAEVLVARSEAAPGDPGGAPSAVEEAR